MVSSCSLFIKLSSGDKEFDSCSMVDQVTFVCVCVCVCVCVYAVTECSDFVLLYVAV